MKHALLLIALALSVSAGGCRSSKASTKEEILAGGVDTAYVVRDGVTFLLWEVPKFIFWTAPKALVYDYPRSAILAIRGNRAQVEAQISRLERGGLTPEEEVEISGDLGYMTGLPIRSTERWTEWWRDAMHRPDTSWRDDFVRGAIHDLEARDYFVRATAIEDLRMMYGTTLDYDPKAAPKGRAEAAERWLSHYRQHGLPPLP